MPEEAIDIAEYPIPLLLDRIDVSVRLKNALLTQYNNKLPFRNLNEFNKMGSRGEIELNKVPNLGKRSINEFKQILKDAGITKVTSSHKNTLVINKLIKLPIKKFILAHDYKLHSFKALFSCVNSNNFPYQNIDELTSLSEKELSDLLINTQQLGTNEINNFVALLNKTVNSTTLISNNISPKVYFNRLTMSVLTDRELLVLNLRFSFHNTEKKTLDNIAQKLSLTRERVRQIESASIKIVRKALISEDIDTINEKYAHNIQKSIFGNNTFISRKLAESKFKQLSAWLRLYIKCTTSTVTSYLDKHHFFSKSCDGWFIHDDTVNQSNSYCVDSFSLADAITRANWPIKIKQLSNIMNTPIPLVIDMVNQYPTKYSINVINNISHLLIKSVNAKDAMRFILRRNKEAMKIEYITQSYNQMFGKRISVGRTNNTLSDMQDALIVDRGTYNLYENMRLNETDLFNIKESTITILMTSQSFMSTKVIHKALLNEPHLYASTKHLNGYSILGILQDDSRFNCKRGLMVGLNDSGFSGTFKMLTVEIQELIKLHDRPLLINEIINMLSETRELIYPSVQALLKSNEEFEETASGAYTVAEHQHREVNLSEKLDVNALFADW